MNPHTQKISDKILKNEEIKIICERHKLSRKEVYDIRSQFISMCIMSDGIVASTTHSSMNSNPDHNHNADGFDNVRI